MHIVDDRESSRPLAKTLSAVVPNASVKPAYRKALIETVNDMHCEMSTKVLRGMKNTGLTQNSLIGVINSILNCVANGPLPRLN